MRKWPPRRSQQVRFWSQSGPAYRAAELIDGSAALRKRVLCVEKVDRRASSLHTAHESYQPTANDEAEVAFGSSVLICGGQRLR